MKLPMEVRSHLLPARLRRPRRDVEAPEPREASRVIGTLVAVLVLIELRFLKLSSLEISVMDM